MKTLIKKLLADWEYDAPERSLSRTSVTVMFLAVLLVVMIPVFLMDFPSRDVALRYAPMADALADGNFNYAFHPRIPMLHPLLAGVVAFLTGCSGFMACKVVSALFFAAGVVPLCGLMKRIFDRRTAMISAIIYACSTPLMPLGYSGLRDSAKSFLLLVMAYALVLIFQERRNFRGYALCGLSCGLAFLVRVDLIILSIVLLWAMFFLECRCCRCAARSFAGLALTVLGALPGFIQNYLQTGAAVPDSYTGTQMIKLIGRNITVPEMIFTGIAAVTVIYISSLLLSWVKRQYLLRLLPAAGVIAAGGLVYWCRSNTLSWQQEYWKGVFWGSMAYYWIVVLPGIIIRIWRKEWRRTDTLLALFFVLHFVVVAGQFILFKKRFYVSDRYLESALPLLFGWAAYFTVMVWNLLDFTQKKWLYPRWCLRTAAAVLIAVPLMIYMIFAYVPVLKLVGQGQKKRTLTELHRIADKIRTHGVETDDDGSCLIDRLEYVPPCKTGMIYFEYRNGRWWRNRNANLVVSYFANVKLVDSNGDYVLYVWKKSAPPPRKPSRPGKMLLKTDDGEKEFQLWSAKR